MASAHILLLRVHSAYIRLGTLGFLWMAPKRSAVWEGWVRLGIPPSGPHASLNGCSAACLSGSTLDASAAGPWFDSRCPSRPSGGSGKGKQRVVWQPPVGRGRWWGALLQVAGLLFLLFAYAVKHLRSIAARQGVVKRIKSGRGPSPQSGGAGGRKHCYKPGSNQRSMRRLPTIVTTTPLRLPWHVAQ